MRLLFLFYLAAFLSGCNSSSSKKDSNKPMDESSPIDNTDAKSIPVIEPVKITAGQLPPSIRFTGKLHEAWQWTDQLGENILITSLVEPYDDKEKNEFGEEGQSAGLHASQFIKKENGYELQWKNDEGEKSCPFDITCGFIKDATTVTDLDKDGVAETKIQYRLACRSDVSPAEMKLFMYEGKEKYSLQGLSWIRSSPEDNLNVTEKDANLETLPGYKKTEEEYMKTFGRYESEKGFAGAPPEFLAYARRHWMKFVKESFE
jgi:hypothetical protein